MIGPRSGSAETKRISSRNLRQNIHSRDIVLTLNSHPEPDVAITVFPVAGEPIVDQLRTLRQNQPVKILARFDDLPRV